MQPTNNQAPTTNQQVAYNEFGSEYDPQVQAVQDQETQLGQTKNTALAQLQQDNTTKLSQLDQARANAFSNNALTANARGLNFSGYAPSQNDAYTTNTYNPNVQAQNTAYQRNVDSTNTDYNNNVQTLQDKITAINQQRANDAYSLTQNTLQAQQEASKEAASAAKSASSTTETTKYGSDAYNQVNSYLDSVKGKDNKVSPQSYGLAFQKWNQNTGGSLAAFNALFYTYQNPNNKAYSSYLP